MTSDMRLTREERAGGTWLIARDLGLRTEAQDGRPEIRKVERIEALPHLRGFADSLIVAIIKREAQGIGWSTGGLYEITEDEVEALKARNDAAKPGPIVEPYLGYGIALGGINFDPEKNF